MSLLLFVFFIFLCSGGAIYISAREAEKRLLISLFFVFVVSKTTIG